MFFHSMRNELLASLVTGLFASFVALLIANWVVTRPLSRVADQARRVAEGDLSRRLDARGDDEVAQLERELNAMCDAIQDARDRAAEEADKRVQALDQLRHVDRLRTVGQLASGIAHELGTPLNVILMRAQMMNADKSLPEGTRDQAASIMQQTERVTRIVKQLMGFARRSTPRRHATAAGELSTRVAQMLGPLAKKAGVRIDVVDEADGTRVMMDAGQIEQVLTNLVVNAVQASKEGGVVTITSELDERAPPDDTKREAMRCIVFSVSDEGIGIDSTDLDRVFDPFFTTKEVGDGSGLGLSVAFGIVEDHGGWMVAESVKGKGSTFSAVLPCSNESEA